MGQLTFHCEDLSSKIKEVRKIEIGYKVNSVHVFMENMNLCQVSSDCVSLDFLRMSLDLNKTCSFVSSVEANIRRLDFLGILTHDPEMCSHKSDMWCYLGLDFQSEAPTNIYIDSVSLHCSNVTSFVQCIFLFTSCVGDSSFGSGS